METFDYVFPCNIVLYYSWNLYYNLSISIEAEDQRKFYFQRFILERWSYQFIVAFKLTKSRVLQAIEPFETDQWHFLWNFLISLAESMFNVRIKR